MSVREGGTGGRWSSPLVVRVLGLLVVLVVAAAGIVASAVSSVGGTQLPIEHGIEQPSGVDHGRGADQGSS